jgi:hypothetical protein
MAAVSLKQINLAETLAGTETERIPGPEAAGRAGEHAKNGKEAAHQRTSLKCPSSSKTAAREQRVNFPSVASQSKKARRLKEPILYLRKNIFWILASIL